MLTLMPLNGIQSALKRRNSKNYDFSRRGSLSVYSTYSLPNSKTSMRRFSSYEELAPIFQLFSSQEKKEKSPKPAKTSSLKPVRRNSTCKRDSKPRISQDVGDACAQLDAQLARIKGKLSQFKNEDLDLSHRVEDLSSSVQQIYDGRVAQPIQHRVSKLRKEKKGRPLSAAAFRREPSPSPSLQVITESHLESSSESDDDQSFEDYCRKNVPKLGVSSGTQKQKPSIKFPALDLNAKSHETTQSQEEKKHYYPNNIVCPKAKSSPVLSVVRNDLTKHDFHHYSKRLSVMSSQSDSVIITHNYHPTSLSFEKTSEAL